MSSPRTAASGNTWLSRRLALYPKHRPPPNSSCNAIARGIVLVSACVASESRDLGETSISRAPRSFPPAGAARPGERAILPPTGTTHPPPHSKVLRAGGREGSRGARHLNFDRVAAGLPATAAPPDPGAAALGSAPRDSAAASLIRNTEGAGPEPARNRIALPRL